MAKIKGNVVVDIEACKGCGVCVSVCPTKVLVQGPTVNSKGYRYTMLTDGIECIGCASCAIVCPDSCLTVYKEKTEN